MAGSSVLLEGHALGASSGAGTVTARTGGPFGWALALVARVPVGGSAPARLEIRGSDRGDVWTRTFGRRRQVSVVRMMGAGRVEERFRCLVMEFEMLLRAGLRLQRARVGWLAFGPRWLDVRCVTRRGDGRLWCRVDATLAGGRLGWLRYEIGLCENPGGDAR